MFSELPDFGSLKGALAYGFWCRFSLIPLAKCQTADFRSLMTNKGVTK